MQDAYRGDVGDLTLDLTRIDDGRRRADPHADRPRRRRPPGRSCPLDADVQLTVESGIGSVDAFGEGTADGFFAGRGTGSWVDDGEPEIALVVHNGLGDVEVSRG